MCSSVCLNLCWFICNFNCGHQAFFCKKYDILFSVQKCILHFPCTLSVCVCVCVCESERVSMSKGFSWRFFKDAFNSFPWAFHEGCSLHEKIKLFSHACHDAYSTLKKMLEYLIYYICLEVSVPAYFFILFRKYIWQDKDIWLLLLVMMCVSAYVTGRR